MEKENREVKRIIDELTDFEYYGFTSKNAFLTAAIRSIQEKQDFQAKKTAEILDQIASLIDVIEAERDVMVDFELPDKKKELFINLIKAASHLADATLVKEDPANWIEQSPGKAIFSTSRKQYRYQWALAFLDS